MGIVKFNTDDHVPGLTLKIGVDIGHFAVIALAGDIGQGHLGRQSGRDRAEFIFINMRFHPDPGQVCDFIYCGPFFHKGALHCICLLCNDPLERGADGEPVTDCPFFFDFSDFFIADVKKAEPPHDGITNFPVCRRWIAAVIPKGFQIVFLNRDQIR